MPVKSKKLVIVESPTKARTIAQYLGPEYEIEASYGHVRDLPKGELGVDVTANFEPRYVIPRSKVKLVNALKKKCKGATQLYLAADPDREGEAIAWHIAQILDDNTKREVKRVVFHEITKEAIAEAFAHPNFINMRLVEAQKARRVLDRLVGYLLSPLLWKKIRRNLSAGRVQSVVVRLIVEREREISDFKPREFWVVEGWFSPDSDESKKFIATLIKKDGNKINIGSKDQADAIVAELKSSTFVVSHCLQKELHRNPHPPFITSTLQQAAATVFGFTAKRTMSVAQSLYEKGYITYMRTDSFNLAESAIAKIRAYIQREFDNRYLPEKPRIYKSKSKVAQEAHEAIRPTDVDRHIVDANEVEGRDEVKLYELIWKQAVASQMEQAVFAQQEVDITGKRPSEGSEYVFRAKFESLKFDGFLALSQREDKENGEEERINSVLLEIRNGQTVILTLIEGKQKFTQPPAHFTEASLIKALEEFGIGRPSTYAPIISTIQERMYVEKEERKFHPTQIGMVVNDFLVKYFSDIVDLSFTAQMEESLDQIARGEAKMAPVMQSFYAPFEKKIEEVGASVEHIEVKDEVTSEVCEKCGKPMVIKMGRFGKFLACSGFPECRNTKPFSKKTGIVCPLCGGDVVVRRTKKGRQFYGCSNYPKCTYASWHKPKEDASKQDEKTRVSIDNASSEAQPQQ